MRFMFTEMYVEDFTEMMGLELGLKGYWIKWNEGKGSAQRRVKKHKNEHDQENEWIMVYIWGKTLMGSRESKYWK